MKKIVLVTLLLAFAAVPLAAQERKIQLTILASQVQFEGDNVFDTGFEVDAEDGEALGASVNYFINPHFSVEGAVFGIRSEAGLLLDDTALFDLGDFNTTVFSAGVQFHVLGDRRIDPYIGAGGAYVIGDEFFSPESDLAGLGRIELESQATYYYGAGLGLQITDAIGVVIDGRQIQYEPSSQSSATGVEQDLELSPRILSVGLRLRF